MMRFFNILFTTIFIALIVGVAGLLVGSMLPIPGNIELKIVKSGSMEPSIPTGSLVVVKPQGFYAVNDVITFGADTKTEIPTTHRILAIEGEGASTMYTTKGDANEEEDQNKVARKEVIGKVIFHAPYVGFILDFARQPLGFALLIGIPAGLIILEEVLTILKELRAALRRRRGEDDDGQKGSSSGGGLDESGAPLRRILARRFAMDEIFAPMYVEPEIFQKEWWAKKLGIHKDTYGTSTAIVTGLIFVSTMLTGGSGETLAYFSDIERSVGNIFRAGLWQEEPAPDPQMVVINEFLPNPDGVAYGFDFGNDASNMPQGEWIELYNNGDVPINVAGWYLTDASGGVGNTHAVIDATNTQPATTTIPAHGWLVVYLNKPSLNDTGDSIFLYTSTSTGSVLVDSYTYDDPSDFCNLEPTPTDPNSTTTPTGTPGNGPNADCPQAQVAPNKSYARIPDGTGAFVDPIPTPGSFNIPDPEPVLEETQEEAIVPEDEPEKPTEEVVEEETDYGGSGGGGGGGGESDQTIPIDPIPDPEISEGGVGGGETSETPPEENPAETGTDEVPPEGEALPPEETTDSSEETPAENTAEVSEEESAPVPEPEPTPEPAPAEPPAETPEVI